MVEASGAPFLSMDKLELGLQKSDPLQGLWWIKQLDLQGLRAGQNQIQPPLQIDSLQVQQASLNLQTHHLDAAEVRAAAVHVRTLRTPQGKMAWIAWPATAQSGAAVGQTDPAKNWVARVGHLALEASSLHFEDRTLSPTAVQDIEQIRLNVDKLDSTPGHANAFTLAATVNKSGALHADGALQWQPLALQLKLDTQALPMSPLQGYINTYLNASMVQGQLSITDCP